MTVTPTSIQLIRSHFDEIAQWHAQGVRWSEIGKQLQVTGVVMNINTLRTLYRRELIRRSSPEYGVAMRWVLDNVDEIARLRNRGFTWSSIVILVPLGVKVTTALATLDMFITAAESIIGDPLIVDPAQQDVSATHQPTAIPLDQSTLDSTSTIPVTAPPSVPPPPPAIPEPTPQPKTPLRAPSPAPQPVTAQSQEAKGPFTGRLAEFNPEFIEAEEEKKAEEERIRQRRERRQNRKSAFDVKEDPYVSVAELRAEYDRWFAIHRERAKLYDEIPESDDTRADEKLERERLRDESNDMTNGYYRLIDTRASHRLTNRSKLCVLSTAALACDAYALTDTDTPDAITLYGFDRPDTIPGMSEIPDPVIIRANLTPDEIERRESAYHHDSISGYDTPQTTSPKRLLAEALILRGAYEFRYNGWIRYDEIVVLSGIDIPSPSLCGHPASRTQLTLAPPPLPDDPIRDDYPSDHRRDLIRERLKGDWL